MQCIAFHLKIRLYANTSWHTRLRSPLHIVRIGIVRRSQKDCSTFHHNLTYALANVFDSNVSPWNWRSWTLRIWMKIGRRMYLVNSDMCGKICIIRSSRLLAVPVEPVVNGRTLIMLIRRIIRFFLITHIIIKNRIIRVISIINIINEHTFYWYVFLIIR